MGVREEVGMRRNRIIDCKRHQREKVVDGAGPQERSTVGRAERDGEGRQREGRGNKEGKKGSIRKEEGRKEGI